MDQVADANASIFTLEPKQITPRSVAPILAVGAIWLKWQCTVVVHSRGAQ